MANNRLTASGAMAGQAADRAAAAKKREAAGPNPATARFRPGVMATTPISGRKPSGQAPDVAPVGSAKKSATPAPRPPKASKPSATRTKFNAAFKAAKAAGKSEFSFGGKKYSTKTK